MDHLQQQLRSLRLVETANELPNIIQQAEKEEVTYRVFLDRIVTFEQKRREAKQIEKRMKWACFPYFKTLKEFDLAEQQSLSKKQLQAYMVRAVLQSHFIRPSRCWENTSGFWVRHRSYTARIPCLLCFNGRFGSCIKDTRDH